VTTVATQMGIRELRDTLTSVIRRVQGGETIEVTHHGRPVALLAPVPDDRIARLVATDDVTPASRPLDLSAPLLPVTGEMTASEAIEDDRAADR
jgi:prevent-host-death family protein